MLHKQLSETMEELASLDVAFTPRENDFLAFDEGDLPKIRAKVPKSGCIISNSCVAHETVATGEGKIDRFASGTNGDVNGGNL